VLFCTQYVQVLLQVGGGEGENHGEFELVGAAKIPVARRVFVKRVIFQ
jgi:hypothetical protein